MTMLSDREAILAISNVVNGHTERLNSIEARLGRIERDLAELKDFVDLKLPGMFRQLEDEVVKKVSKKIDEALAGG